MMRFHLDAYSAVIGTLLLAGIIWLMLAILNPLR